jgi:hypothetical protein
LFGFLATALELLGVAAAFQLVEAEQRKDGELRYGVGGARREVGVVYCEY